MQPVATIAFVIGIAGLFLLNRDLNIKTSKALWVPVMWLLIAGSRNVGEWLHVFTSGAVISREDAYLEGNPVDRAVLGLLILLAVITLLARHRRIGELLRKNPFIYMFILYCAVSILWSDYPAVGFRRWNRAIGDILMAMVVATDLDWLSAVKRLLTRTSFLLVPLSILFIRYYPDIGRAYGLDGTPYWGGVTGGKNSLGMISMVFGLGSLWRVISALKEEKGRNRKRLLIAHGTVFAMAAWLLHEVHSATSLACFGFAAVVLILSSRRTVAHKPVLVNLLVVAVVAFSIFALFFDSGDLLSAVGRNSTLTGRTDVWTRVLGIDDSPIFGSGFETFWLGDRLQYMQRLDVGLNQAHNGYIEIYLNLGLCGLALLAAMLVKGYKDIVIALKRDHPASALALGYLVIALIYDCTESGFKMMSPIWIFLLVSLMVVRTTAALEVAPSFSMRSAPRLAGRPAS